MKFSLTLPIDKIEKDAGFIGQAAIVEMARTAEEAGFDACNVSDHPVPTGRWLDGGGHYAQDPFVMLAMAGAVTTRIRLHTGIIVLPYRNPFLTARAVATLDAFTGGRVILGVAVGYLKAEYRALGVDFDDRNDLSDEYLRAMITAWTHDEFTFKGTGYEALGNRILPRPLQSPHPPLWVGGNSRRAMRRAVDFGDAWSPFYAPPLMAKTARTTSLQDGAQLPEALATMREYAGKQGRATIPELVGDGFGSAHERTHTQLVDDIARLAEVGMSWVTTHVGGVNRAEWCDNVRRYGAEVVSRLR